MLYSHNNQFPGPLPERIRLSSGLTRTDSSTFTEEEITDAGYVLAGENPSFSDTEKVIWNGSAWEVIALTEEEIASKTLALWGEIRETRNEKIKEAEWRIFRYQSEVRLGITTTTDSISKLDTYMQKLRDITSSVSEPEMVTWPDDLTDTIEN